MAHITPPPPSALPSTAQLQRAAALATVIAIVLAFVVVLPAERAIDVTGLGNVLGLTEMGMIKMQFRAELAAEAAFRAATKTADSLSAAEKAAILSTVAAGTRPERTDTTRITVGPGEERPILFRMRAKAWTIYTWSVSRGMIDYDIRGDSAGADEWWYHRYESGSAAASGEGVLVAKFSGVHGWYWKNNGDAPAIITLITRGNYSGVDK